MCILRNILISCFLPFLVSDDTLQDHFFDVLRVHVQNLPYDGLHAIMNSAVVCMQYGT